jgi:Ring finger domain
MSSSLQRAAAASTTNNRQSKPTALSIGSFVKTRQGNHIRYGQIVDVVTDVEDDRRVPNLWQIKLFHQESASISVQSTKLTHINEGDIPESFVIDASAAAASASTAPPSQASRRNADGTQNRTKTIEIGINDDNVDRMADVFVEGIDISSMTTEEAVKAGMRFCHENIKSRLQMSNKRSVGLSSSSATRDEGKFQHTQQRPNKLARIIRDNECAICSDDMKDNEILVTYPCGHALHANCFVWYNNSMTDSKTCPTCQQTFSVGPPDGGGGGDRTDNRKTNG